VIKPSSQNAWSQSETAIWRSREGHTRSGASPGNRL
jgi:hypothetical protein